MATTAPAAEEDARAPFRPVAGTARRVLRTTGPDPFSRSPARSTRSTPSTWTAWPIRRTSKRLRCVFTDPDSLKSGQTQAGVTKDVADRFARLAEGERHDPPRHSAHFLMKLMSSMFAED
jgi:hypothetical protein